jgi:integrase
MAKKIGLKKYTGVYYTESTIRKWRDRPDRIYWIAFKDSESKLHWERCGSASEGWTPEAAQRRRFEVLESDRVGDYKPKAARKAESFTFAELWDNHYLPWAEQNKSRVRDDKGRYNLWLKDSIGSKKLTEIAPLDIERIKKTMRDAGKSEATVRHVFCIVRQAYNKALAWKLWTGVNPCSQVKAPKPNNARQRFLSKDEAATLLAALYARSDQLGRISELSLLTGLRLGEVFGLKWADIDYVHNVMTVMNSKNGETRHIHITGRVRELLESIPTGTPDEFVFKASNGKQAQWLSKVFHEVLNEQLGMNKGIEDPRQKISFHTLRHTFASWAVMAGIPLYVVGKCLGHKTSAMTERYSHLAPDSQRAAFETVAAFQTEKPAKPKTKLKGKSNGG